MLLSMTGYGAGQTTQSGVSVSVELRTVNNRYLKLHSRLPDGYAKLEGRMEEVIRKRIRRGAVQLNVDLRHNVEAADYQINRELLQYYTQQALQLCEENDVSNSAVSAATLMGLPGVIQEEKRRNADADEHWTMIEATLELALQDLTHMREVEGAAMSKDLSHQIQEIRRCGTEVEKLAPQVVDAYQTRLTDRLNKLLKQHDVAVQPADVVREVGVFAERVDISEEIVRLSSHLDQFEEIMSSRDGGGGRKLEFFVQELLRETNTIGSKANNAEIARHVVEIKTNIERIREMVQNVE